MKKFFSILHFTLLKISYIICTNKEKQFYAESQRKSA
jgi:hypothetical protein